MNYRIFEESDFGTVIEQYIDYYNNVEGSQWTYETAYRRIHQVWRQDSYCLIAEDKSEIIGFCMGYLQQYDDIVAYTLEEIVIAYKHQGKGYGTELLRALELLVLNEGATMIQLQSVNDNMHNHFYSKLQYTNTNSLIGKSKWLNNN